MLILRTLLYRPAPGHQIQPTRNDFLPDAAWIVVSRAAPARAAGTGKREVETARDRNSEFMYYRLMEKGGKQLVVDESQWKKMAEAVA